MCFSFSLHCFVFLAFFHTFANHTDFHSHIHSFVRSFTLSHFLSPPMSVSSEFIIVLFAYLIVRVCECRRVDVYVCVSVSLYVCNVTMCLILFCSLIFIHCCCCFYICWLLLRFADFAQPRGFHTTFSCPYLVHKQTYCLFIFSLSSFTFACNFH